MGQTKQEVPGLTLGLHSALPEAGPEGPSLVPNKAGPSAATDVCSTRPQDTLKSQKVEVTGSNPTGGRDGNRTNLQVDQRTRVLSLTPCLGPTAF